MADNVFRTINGRGIEWDGHRCEGSDVHPGIRLLWTLCRRDVPANAAYLVHGNPDPACEKCRVALDTAARVPLATGEG